MLLGFVLDVAISRLKDDRVGSFTAEANFAIGDSKDDRHPPGYRRWPATGTRLSSPN